MLQFLQRFGVGIMGKSKKFFISSAAVIMAAVLLAGCGIRFGRPENPVEPLTEPQTEESATTRSGNSINSISQKETDPEGTPVMLTGQMQYEANIFLSNFAEQYGFTSYDVASHDVRFMIDFAHRYAKINDRGQVTYDQLYEVITLDYVNMIVDRFFGDAVIVSELQGIPAPTYSFDSDYHGPYYQSGLFYYDAADGATTTDFVVVDSVHSFPDGTMDMVFTKYELLDFYDKIGGLAVTDEYYAMTPEQARASADLNQIGSGWATVVPKYYNGRDSYQLIKYQEY